MSPEEELARKRFTTIQYVRWAGVGMAVVGAMIVGGKLDWNPWLGAFLLINGAFDVLILPALLARRWRKPGP